MGLVNQVRPGERLLEAFTACARDLAGNVSPRSMQVSMQAMKHQVCRAILQSLEDLTLLANADMPGSFASDDFREGIAHFVERRPARFSGQ